MAENFEAEALNGLQEIAKQQAQEIAALKSDLRRLEAEKWSLEGELQKVRKELETLRAGAVPFQRTA